MRQLAIAWSLATVTAPSPSSAASPCDAAIRTQDVDEAAFRAATALRLPQLRLREATSDIDETCSNQLRAFVEVRPTGPGIWELTLILSDGRAWYRTIASEPDQAARTAASALANLLAAIEEDALVPDAEDVALPSELAELAEPDALPEPAPPPPDPVPVPPRDPPASNDAPLVERPAAFEISPYLAGAGLIGLVPAPGLRAVAGELGALGRLRSGVAIEIALRVAGRQAAPLGLGRIRGSVGVGYSARTGSFEVPIIAAATLESWWVREEGRRVELDAPVLLGGALRLAPGGRVELGRVDLRIGASLELGVAVEPRGSVPSVRLDPAAEPRVWIGGVELAAGLVVGSWIPVRGLARR